MSLLNASIDSSVSSSKLFRVPRYLLSDGQARSEKGILTRIGNAEVYDVSGSYSFRGSDGKLHLVDYSSGIDGYKATVHGN